MADPLARYIARHRQRWEDFERQLAIERRTQRLDLKQARALFDAHRALTQDIALLRDWAPDSALRRQLEAMYLQSLGRMATPARHLGAEAKDFFGRTLPRAIAAIPAQIGIAAGLFALAAIAGALLVGHYPDTALMFLSPLALMELQQGRLWTDHLTHSVPPSVLSGALFTNNLTVALTAYALGAMYGLGTLYILGLNGFLLGALFAATHHYGLAGRLLEFVVAHGCLELTTLIVIAAAGMKLGDALVHPGQRTRAEALRQAVQQTAPLLILGGLALIVAGLIEGYISPSPTYPWASRVIIGVSVWLLFAWLALGGLRRFAERRILDE
jgi:uncharacterized membrane protein SpoIIM required for sporulation